MKSDTAIDGIDLYFQCIYCSVQQSCSISAPPIPYPVLYEACIRDRLQQDQIHALNLLRRYTNGILTGDSKRINTGNEKFKQFLGMSDDIINLFSFMGFNLRDGFLIPPENCENIESYFKQISLFEWAIRDLMDVSVPADLIPFQDATSHLSLALGSKQIKNSIRELNQLVSGSTDSKVGRYYTNLGIVKGSPLAHIKFAYESMVRESPLKIGEYLDNLCQIGISENDFDLQEFIVMEKSKGVYSETDIAEAYKILGVDKEATDDEILNHFQSQFAESIENLDEYRRNLRIIAENRSSVPLEHFLNTGEHYGQEQVDVAPVECKKIDLPAGLLNIGSSCYLNSLLQFYFTIIPLRNAVLSSKPVEKSFEFHLKNLFAELGTSRMNFVVPSEELVQLALPKGDANQQQDIGESMGKILELLETEHSKLLEDLFYGKVTGAMVKDNAQLNEQAVWSFFVNVKPRLYDSLNEYFGAHKVDFEGQMTCQTLSISQLPKLLNIQFQRVGYDRQSAATFKSNQFVQFPFTLYMDRYLSENSKAWEQMQKKIDSIEQEIKKENERLLKESKSKRTAEQLKSDIDKMLANPPTNLSPEELNEKIDIEFQELSEVESLFMKHEQTIKRLNESKESVEHGMNKHEYKLHAVFIHEGLASFGHYWVYIYDHKTNQWFKFNDSTVSKVKEDVVFSDTTGSNANVYCLVYVNNYFRDQLVDSFGRRAGALDH